MAIETHSRHLLIIASDPVRAGLIVDACRDVDGAALYTPDPIYGLIHAMRDEPAMVLIDFEDASLGGVSVIEEIRRHPRLRFTPVMLLTGSASGSPGARGIEHEADFVEDVQAPDLADRIRNCLSVNASNQRRASTKPSVIFRVARAAQAVAVRMTSPLASNQVDRPTLTATPADPLCNGNLFRRIGDPKMLYELRVRPGKLLLMPIERGQSYYCFEDAETLLNNFQHLPFA